MNRNHAIRKYPRTPHIEGSKLQIGDHDLSQIPIGALKGRPLVIEEKIDGANAGLSFDARGRLLLQSRGHYLAGGPRERHFAMFKTWASSHQQVLFERLQDRFLVYGEWAYARHTIFYDALPNYFLEFDVFDRVEEIFLNTPRRQALLDGLPIASCPVLYEGTIDTAAQLRALVGPSRYRTAGWRDALVQAAENKGQDVDRVLRETDRTRLAEGLYIKVEDDRQVRDRTKWVRKGFLDAVAASGGHWMERPILPNQLAEGVDIFATR
ncbi:MAG: RNA ligase family protein [Myxococcota bacterium]